MTDCQPIGRSVGRLILESGDQLDCVNTHAAYWDIISECFYSLRNEKYFVLSLSYFAYELLSCKVALHLISYFLSRTIHYSNMSHLCV